MLLLTRDKGETIVITTSDGTITVKLIKPRSGSAMLGIDAPRQCRVVRGEVIEREREKPAI